MPWMRLRDHPDLYNDILFRHWHGDHINTEWMQDTAAFQNIMLEDYGIELSAGPAMILTRREFSDHFNQEHPGLGDADSALWEPERYEPHTRPSEWFLCAVVPGLREWDWDRPGYWRWVSDYCRGQVLCYSMDGESRGWWGFEHRDDIMLWSLRWAA